ncbi:MAG: hypothetical protein FD180_4371 [Planctomycetota bacterium]|nr:MAG: hypothetical protein FD180_4371 [Planctomycetota bacterium]
MKHLVPVLLSVLVLASCGKSDSSSSSGGSSTSGGGGGSAATLGGATPQETFDKAKASGEKKDFGMFYDIIHPDDHDMALFMFTFMAGMSTMNDDAKKKEFEELGRKHGLVEKKDGPSLDLGDPAKMKEGVKEMFKDVKEKRAFFLELAAWTEKNSKQGEGWKVKPSAKLKSAKEEGEVAKCVIDTDGKESQATMKKHNGRWFMTMDK